MKRTEKTELTVSKILDAALEEFGANGYAGGTITYFFETILQPQEKLRDRIQKILQPFEEINEKIYRSVVSGVTMRDGITKEDAIDYFRQMQRMFNGYFSSSAYRHMALDEQIREHEMNLSKLLDFMLYGIAKGGMENWDG